MRSLLRTAMLFALMTWVSPVASTLAQEARDTETVQRDLTEWLSVDVAAVARVRDLGDNIDGLLASDLWRRLMASKAYQAMLADDGMGKLLALLTRVHESTGRTPQQLVADLLGRDVVVAARPGFGLPVVTLLSRAPSPAALAETVARVRDLLTEQIGHWPFEEVGRAKSVPLYGWGRVFYATHEDVLLVSSSVNDLRRCLALGYGKGGSTVRDAGMYRDAGNLGPEGPLVSVAARNVDLLSQSLPERSENFIGSLLVGGWVEALRRSELITLDLAAGADGLTLDLASIGTGLKQHLVGFTPTLFGTRGSLLDRLDALGLLSGLELHRDFAAFWRRGEELVDASGRAQMLEFSQTMNLVFGGRSFADEVLPQLGPTVTLVARNETYAELGGVPQPAIPGFAAIFEMRDPARFGRRFAAALQTLIGIINLDRAQNGQGDALLLVEPEQVHGVTVYVANRVDPPAANATLGLEDNFTPSMAVVGDHLVLSSTRELAREVVEGILRASADPGDRAAVAVTPVDRFTVSGGQLYAILDANLEVLVANRMMEKGIGLEAARQELSVAMELLGLVGGLDLESRLADDALRMRVVLRPTVHPEEEPATGERERF